LKEGHFQILNGCPHTQQAEIERTRGADMNIEKIVSDLTLEEKAKMCSGADFWHLQGLPGLGIPSIMATDGPHGLRKQKGAGDHLGINESIVSVCFPTAAALAASFDRELLKDIGVTLGRECQAEDVGILLGPGTNIKRSPLCGRNFEYFSEDPYVSSELSSAYINGLQSEGIACSIKHFLANNQETERMFSDSVMDERTLHEIYLASFEGGIRQAKAKTVMCSYNRVNGVFSAENEEMLNGILRGKWGFDGIVITDWGAGKDEAAGINAGLDLRMPGGDPKSTERLIHAVEAGELKEDILDETVKRILKVIDFVVSNKKTGLTLDHKADHEKAGNAAIECAVLLKNEGNLLPLPKSSRAVFIGAFAETPRYQGSGSSFINSYQVDSALDIASKMQTVTYARGYDLSTDETDDVLLEEARQAAIESDIAIIFAGLPNSYESEGFDRKHIDMPDNQNVLIEEICKVQPNTVVVLHNGACVAMPWVNRVKAVLEMYLGGEAVGSAAVKLLYGDAVPSGKLAESFPYQLSDNPSYLNYPGYNGRVEYREGLYVGYRYYDTKKMDVLFPFGHGLSYTQFAYSAIRLDKEKMKDTDTLKVTVNVKNTGDVAAKEVVQLYVRPLDNKVPRPVHELRGFEKVFLQPGEAKEVTICLGKRAFAYYNESLHDWHVESGEYEIEIGASSRDIRLKGTIYLISTVEVPVIFTQYSTIGQVTKTERGRYVLDPVLKAIRARRESNKETSNKAMGEGNEEMQETMHLQMPLNSLVTFGVVTAEKLAGIVSELNSGQLKGIYNNE